MRARACVKPWPMTWGSVSERNATYAAHTPSDVSTMPTLTTPAMRFASPPVAAGHTAPGNAPAATSG